VDSTIPKVWTPHTTFLSVRRTGRSSLALIMSFDNEEISRELKRVTLADVIVTTVETSTTSVSVTDSPPPAAAAPDHSPHTGARDSVDADPAPDDATTDESTKLTLCSEDATSTKSPTLRPNPLSLPLTIRKIYDIAGARTALHIQLFADRTLLTCSQLPEGSIASWLLCKPAISMAPAAYQRSSSGSSNRGYNNNNIDLDVLPLLGAARDGEVVVYTVLAKQIFGTLPVERREMPILLGLGLPRLVASAPAGADGVKLFHTIAHLMGGLYLNALGL
jgi:hypothetical protein